MSSRILVIGVSGKYRDSDVYSWRRMENERPLIGDYSNVIIYMPSLHSDPFEAPGHAREVFNTIKKGVVDALQGSINIHCIISPPVRFSNSNSYDLIPFELDYDIETGKNFKHKAADDLPYIKRVTGWHVAFKDYPHSFAVDDVQHNFVQLARTNHEKNAAFRIEFRHQNTGTPKGKLSVLPPILDSKDPSEEKTINELLDYFAPIQELEIKLPERYQTITLPGEAELREEDTKLEQAISNDITRRDIISADLAGLEQLKGIVAFKGKPLEKCVDAALKKLGVDYDPTETNKEDGNLTLAANLKIPVEIKGHETKGASEKDLRQVIARLKDETVSQSVRGLLVVNPFYTLSETEQSKKKAFESSVIQQAKAFNIALLETRVLLKYVADQLKDGSNQLLAMLAKNSGEVPHQKSESKKE